MSLRKVSSLPGLNVDSVDFNIDRFKDSLFEISYEQDDPHTYKSMYIDGENLYIPRKTENKQEWGKGTGIRQELFERNTSIFQEYLKGCRVEELAGKYFLSEKRIQRIIHEMKKTA